MSALNVTGEPGGDRVKCGIPIGDLSAGLLREADLSAEEIAAL